MTSLNAVIAAEHVADLRRVATRARIGQSQAATEAASGRKAVVLRLANADDARALSVLAELDEAPQLSGDALLALIDGEAVAAMSLGDGRVVANPFVATAGAVSLLKLRAKHLRGRDARHPRRRWHLRFA
jgi:hypothetical protein